MLLLAIDTSSACVSVAVLSDERVLAARLEKMERGQAEVLIPLIQSVLETAGVMPSDLHGVAVGVGPGSFTGVRVGLSTARAIGLALSIPVMGVTNFEAAAFGLPRPLAVVLDTKRGDYYTQFLMSDEAKEPAVQTAEMLAERLPFTAVGDGAATLAEQIGCSFLENTLDPAVCVGKIALGRLDAPMPAEPFYLRGADVTV